MWHTLCKRSSGNKEKLWLSEFQILWLKWQKIFVKMWVNLVVFLISTKRHKSDQKMDKLSSALDFGSNRENLNDIGHWPLCPGYWVTLKLAFWKLSPSINSQQRLYSRIFLQTYPSKYDVWIVFSEWIHAFSPSILFNGTFDVLLSAICDRSFCVFCCRHFCT